MKTASEKLLDKHQKLVHTEGVKVLSHVQRQQDDWIINTLMLDGVEVPFKYKRKQQYKSLAGQRINITYYPATETVAGFDIEVMNIVRIRIS
ncbi:hypothetical protein SG34_019570 [Thalassomonas viridans]|uniref:Uncharacterized protein n=1 Tax=Thalassomonas viridans TaxID=137584 RepID=A0AAF0C7D2_9GAMM|nr:hypothetical protein [Thalassomonas viridans]WDE03568.1 hypothetical protein SG34_019570 [Thalassomonas viridans]